MKVLHLVKTSTGASWALRLMRELVKSGIEVHAALPYKGTLISKYEEYGIKVHELDYSLGGIFSTGKRLQKLVKEIKPDIVHSHFVLTTLIMRLALRNLPTPRIFEVPGPMHLENTFFRNLEIRLKQPVDYWIPTCKWSLERYRKSGIADDHLFLSYYGGEISHRTYQAGLLRKELGLPSNARIIGMVAYMYAPKRYLGQKRGLKGHEDFIDALAIVSRKHPNVYGVCIGGAWDGAVDYERQVREYGTAHCPNVIFLGTRNNVGELYQDVDVVVHPSHSENLGGAGESLALGKPTIATSVGGFPDIVIDGETGLLVPPHNPQALAVAIEEMLNHPEDAKNMAIRGQRLVNELTDLSRTSRQMLDIYQDILDKGR